MSNAARLKVVAVVSLRLINSRPPEAILVVVWLKEFDMPISKQIDDIQEDAMTSLWKHEEHDFTPWLLENISRLGDAIGIEMNVETARPQREFPVGRYVADIVATEVGNSRTVIIENQLTASDHSHLGQLITYAAGTEASTIIWVCWKMREEHRSALSWLNTHTNQQTNFFGVEVEILRIGDSKPAVRFNPVVYPLEWDSSSTGTTATRTGKYQKFFQLLIDELRDKHNFTAVRKGQEQSYYAFALGFTRITYNVTFTAEKVMRCELYIDTTEATINKAIFDALTFDRTAIESEIGAELEWDRGDNRQSSRIYIATKANVEDEDSHNALKNWAVDYLIRFKKAFSPRLPAIITQARQPVTPP